MIDTSDLMLGNLVIINNPKHHPNLKNIPLIITGINLTLDCDKNNTYSISLEHVNQKENTYYESYSQFIKFIEPIELTEEILTEKCRFIKSNYDSGKSYLFNKTFELWRGYGWDHYLWMVVGRNEDNINEPWIKIKYLHELQNLYRIIESKNLKITI